MLGTGERALLERLEDESVLARVFRAYAHGESARTERASSQRAKGQPTRGQPAGGEHATPGASALPPRAAGLLTVLRETSAGSEAVARARAGDLAALHALLEAPAEAARSPRLLHHLALFLGAAADAAHVDASHSGEPATRERAARLELRTLDVWALLLSEGQYLTSLAERVADGSLSAVELSEAVEAAALERVRALGLRLTHGVGARTDAGKDALRLLHAARARSCPDAVRADVAARVSRESERLLRSALDGALAASIDRFAQAETDPDGSTIEQAVLVDAAELYAWSEGDWFVALFVLERAVPTGWGLYKAKRWDTLTQLGESLRALVDGAARRVEEDPSALPYASLVAQMLVFRAEMGKTLATRIQDGERALRLCDTHRNARVILADLLAERATATLDGTGLLGRDAAVDAALRDLARADELWAGLPRVANLRKRIDRMSGVTR